MSLPTVSEGAHWALWLWAPFHAGVVSPALLGTERMEQITDHRSGPQLCRHLWSLQGKEGGDDYRDKMTMESFSPERSGEVPGGPRNLRSVENTSPFHPRNSPPPPSNLHLELLNSLFSWKPQFSLAFLNINIKVPFTHQKANPTLSVSTGDNQSANRTLKIREWFLVCVYVCVFPSPKSNACVQICVW